MEVANPAAALAPAPAPTGGDWRSQLRPGAREVMVKQIMKTLKKHIPMTDQEGLNRLRNLAEGFEQKFYTGATSQSSYSRKIAMLLLYVETPNQNPHHPAPGVSPQGNNPAESSAVPLMSQQKIRQGNTSAYVQAPSLPSPGQRLTNIGQTSALQNMSGQTSALQNMSGKSTIPQIQMMAMQSATQSVLQHNPLNTAQESDLLLLQQSPEWVLGQQRHLQLSMHQQPSVQQTQPTQQPNRPLQQQLIGQQPNLHKNQIKCQQGAAELQQQQRLTVQSNHHTSAFEAGAHLGILENNADEEGKGSMLESPGDETIEQDWWDGIFCPPASDNEAANFQSSSFSDDLILPSNVCLPLPAQQEDGCLSSATLAAWEDPDYVPMADGATNLKKRKFDCSSSWAPTPIFSAPVDDHCSAPVPSFPEIPEGGLNIQPWVNRQQFQGWAA